MQINNPSGGAPVGSNNALYATTGAGAQTTLNYGTTASGNLIVQRTGTGVITGVTPVSTVDVVIKSYSDAQFSPNTRTAVNALTGASTASDIVTALKTL